MGRGAFAVLWHVFICSVLFGRRPFDSYTASGNFAPSPRPRFDLKAVQSESREIAACIRATRQGQLNRVGPDDPTSPLRVLAELDILNACDRIRLCYLNIAETLDR